MALTISTVDTLINAISSLIVVDGKATFSLSKKTNYFSDSEDDDDQGEEELFDEEEVEEEEEDPMVYGFY